MKIIAVASGGGHWIELMRLKPLFDEHEVVYISTNPGFAKTVEGYKYYTVPDGNRWNKLKLVHSAWKSLRILLSEKPDAIISTGSAPGVTCLLLGKLLGCTTIWIDSISCTEKISMSGRFAKLFCDRVYTQWPHLQSKSFVYHGKVMS